MKQLIGVIGSSNASGHTLDVAFEVGRQIIISGFSLICGGLYGVMEAACRGAFKEAGKDSGRIIGILPGTSKADANQYVDIVIPTGIGYARNMIIACASDAVIAVAGGSGTLSELSMAWQYGKPIVVIKGLDSITETMVGKKLDDRRSDLIIGAESPQEAISIIKEILNKKTVI